MKVLFIGGTGNISTPVSELAVAKGIDLYHLNRGQKEPVTGVTSLIGDISKPKELAEVLKGHTWDVVVNWIAFNTADVERDIELFKGKTKQYVFISSASCYQKPPTSPIITESTPLKNPYWDYSREKIASEEVLIKAYREFDFPVTIVRPSHTYYSVFPITLGGWTEYTAVHRMKKGLPVIIQGDGTSLWTVTHARDFAKAFVGLMNHPLAIGEAFHITSDEALTWNQIYTFLAHAAGVEPNIIHIPSAKIIEYADRNGFPSEEGNLWGDKSHCALFDNSKIKKLVPDYVATIPFSEGIKETLAWFEAKPERMIINETTNRFLSELAAKYI
ncbi:SDR family oxidoreductase [Jiulongibacter sp. NS-SX5]|uniref:SDR family oxidoreductase n=1 Tax=Jiulongibacter sp. NS-SX5 TaxID=3463854 RepID=UPI0040592F16